jgi:hypothetical protein
MPRPIIGQIEVVPPDVPEDVIPQLKQRAAALGVSDELRAVRVDGIEHDFVLRRPTRKEWQDYVVKQHDDAQSVDGQVNLALLCTMWPSRKAVTAARDLLPALPIRLCNWIELMSGGKVGTITETPIDTTTEEDVLAGLAVPTDVLASLLSRFTLRNQIRVIAIRVSGDDDPIEEITIVVKRPDKATYDNLLRGWRAGDKAVACYNAAMSCVVYPQSDVDKRALFEERPGIPYRLFATMIEMGGGIGRETAKKL